MAVWFRMYRWAIRPENQDEAKSIFDSADKNEEPHFSYEVGAYNQYNFDQWLKSQAKTSLYGRPRVFKSVVKSLNWLYEYTKWNQYSRLKSWKMFLLLQAIYQNIAIVKSSLFVKK